MILRPESNNNSCASIPDSVFTGFSDKQSSKAFSWIHWISDAVLDDNFAILAEWNFGINGKNCKRAHRSGGMNRLDFMRFYRNGKELTGPAREWCKQQVKDRIDRLLGIDFTSGILFRSRFVHIATHPFKSLIGLEVHHIIADNKYASLHADMCGVQLHDEWLKGTDDRPCNLIAVTPDEHREIHKKQGDWWWFTSGRNYEPGGRIEVNINPLPTQNSGFQPSTTPPSGTPIVLPSVPEKLTSADRELRSSLPDNYQKALDFTKHLLQRRYDIITSVNSIIH